MNAEEMFALAVERHKAGRLQEAEGLYRQILIQEPAHAGALHYLGLIANQRGQNESAVGLLQRALTAAPERADIHSDLGVILKQAGRLDDAIGSFRRAIALKPGYAEALFNLGNALKDREEMEEAIASYRQSLSASPNSPQVLNNLAAALKTEGRLAEAHDAIRQALAIKPNYVEALFNLGNILVLQGHPAKAMDAYKSALRLDHNYADAWGGLGRCYRIFNQLDAAIEAYRKALHIRPKELPAYLYLAEAMGDKSDWSQSAAVCRQAIKVLGKSDVLLSALSNALRATGDDDEAIEVGREAIAHIPDSELAYHELGNALKSAGRVAEAIDTYRLAMRYNADSPKSHSNLIYTMEFCESIEPTAIADERRRFNEMHCIPLAPHDQPSNKIRSSPGRLKIGYVSADFRNHVIGRNMVPLFQHHDLSQFEIVCYADVTYRDALTRHFQSRSSLWRPITDISDERLAEMVREDEIDILVDLTLHLSGSRLLTFARKPAPIQVTFAGYPGSTGLTAIDYRLSDPYLDPIGNDQSLYSEKTLRLPHSFWCYDPIDRVDIGVSALPASANGFVTFGCLNNFCKVNDRMLAVWARVMQRVANSRLVLLASRGSHRNRLVSFMEEQGIGPGRVSFVSPGDRLHYLQHYWSIDISLDSYPYNGHTTALDSFWMGVPVVTLVGPTPVSRAGWSQLSNLGLTELAAKDSDQFVEVAVALGNDLPRLGELRLSLRRRMENSPLMDGKSFARGIEAAYRTMWDSQRNPEH